MNWRKLVSKNVVVSIFLLLLITAWFFKGEAWLKDLLGESSGAEYLQKTVKELKATDPEAAKAISEIARKADVEEWALAFKAREKDEGLSGVRTLAREVAQGRPSYEKIMVGIASRANAFAGQEDRDVFLETYAAYFAPIGAIDASTLDEYSLSLERFAAEPAFWHAVKDDPTALLLLRNNVFDNDMELLDFYAQNKDWIQPALFASLAYISQSDNAKDNLALLKNIIKRAQQFYPASKAFAEIKDDDASSFAVVFLEYAHVLAPAVAQYRIPAEEAADVVFANMDQYRAVSIGENFTAEVLREGENQAKYLAQLRDQKKATWNKAREYPLVLRFEKDALEASERLLDRHPEIPEFIYSLYPDEPVQAIRAADIFGDPGIYILSKYSHSERLHTMLKDPKIGVRIVPLLLKSGDEGFSLLNDDIRWLDRYVNPDGTLRDDSQGWLSSIPFVGAPLVVIKNWKNGYPNTWGELGWATFDVAGSVMLLSSLKTGAVVAKGAASYGDDAARIAGRTAATYGDDAIRVAGTTKSLLGRFSAIRFAQVSHIASGAGSIIKKGFAATIQTMKNPLVKRWGPRVLLGVYLTVTVTERTVPNLPALGAKIGEVLGKTVNSVVRGTINAGTAFLIESFGGKELLFHWADWLYLLGFAFPFMVLLLLGRVSRLIFPKRS